MLPTEAKDRKHIPIATGFLDYFPDAVAEVAKVSYLGNEQHNPGTSCHWDRSKSGDEADALMRHFLERGKYDVDGTRHSAKMAWRALALLQKEIEAELAQLPAGELASFHGQLVTALATGKFDREEFLRAHQAAQQEDTRTWVDFPPTPYPDRDSGDETKHDPELWRVGGEHDPQESVYLEKLLRSYSLDVPQK